LLWVACKGGAPGPGEERGNCYPNGTCNDGLVCLSDLCVRLPDAGSGFHGNLPPNAILWDDFEDDRLEDNWTKLGMLPSEVIQTDGALVFHNGTGPNVFFGVRSKSGPFPLADGLTVVTNHLYTDMHSDGLAELNLYLAPTDCSTLYDNNPWNGPFLNWMVRAADVTVQGNGTPDNPVTLATMLVDQGTAMEMRLFVNTSDYTLWIDGNEVASGSHTAGIDAAYLFVSDWHSMGTDYDRLEYIAVYAGRVEP